LNANDVVRQVQHLFGDSFEVQIKVEDIIDWINESLMTIARETEYKTSTQTTALYGPTTLGVDLPVDFIGEKRVTWDGTPLNKTELTALDDLGALPSDIGPAVSHFYFWEDKTWLYPQPGTAKPMLLYYVAAPTLVGDMNIPLALPLHFHKDIVRMCMVRARELNEDWDQARVLQNEIDANLGKTRDDQQNRGRETFPVVRDDPADWMH